LAIILLGKRLSLSALAKDTFIIPIIANPNLFSEAGYRKIAVKYKRL